MVGLILLPMDAELCASLLRSDVESILPAPQTQIHGPHREIRIQRCCGTGAEAWGNILRGMKVIYLL